MNIHTTRKQNASSTFLAVAETLITTYNSTFKPIFGSYEMPALCTQTAHTALASGVLTWTWWGS